MKLLLLNTAEGLKPMYDDDYDEKRRLRIGQTYEAQIKVARNIRFHRLYFALINCAWEYLTERQRDFFHNVKESFRKTVEIAAGHYELIYSMQRKEWVQIPRSIAFDRLDETEFSSLYERVKDVLFSLFLSSINKEEFERQLSHF